MREIHVNVPTGRESGGKKVREIQLNVPSRRGSGEREMKNIQVIMPTRTGRQAMEREGYKRNSIQCTVAPRNTGCQGTNKFYLLLADFRYCHYRKLKEMT